jgi:hypothetical protein
MLSFSIFNSGFAMPDFCGETPARQQNLSTDGLSF